MDKNGAKLTRDEYEATRRDVLTTWPTGEGLELEEGFKVQQALPPEKNFSTVLNAARREGRILLQPRAGVALIDEHIRLLRYLEDEGGADLLPTTIDAYTRQNRYPEAAAGITKSLAAGTSLLNGFPAVNHGLKGCMQVVENVSRPVQVRHGTPDARLLAEISLAAGFTSYEGGGISYNIPYAKRVPLRTSLHDWQYVDRLIGLYEEAGIRINREPFGPLTGTLVPPCLSHAVAILEGLLALEQGARCLTLGYGQAGNLVQDMAAMQSLRELADHYFHERGFTDYELTTVFHQWMGGFPADEAKAFSVISWGGVVAALSGADKVIVKTPHEAMGIPTMEANAQGLKTTRQAINMVKDQAVPKGESLQREIDLIKDEVHSLMQKVFELGTGEVLEGVVAAFGAGVLDIPFAPSIHNCGKVLPMRDDEGFVRIFQHGHLPLSDEVKTYHRDRLQARADREGRDVCFQMVTDDIYAISKGKLVGRPR
ncbi:MAG: methylaspartate mutase subunit E [Planctomycetota bacterium]|jgi:methylaspartate mutase epsilon subunit